MSAASVKGIAKEKCGVNGEMASAAACRRHLVVSNMVIMAMASKQRMWRRRIISNNASAAGVWRKRQLSVSRICNQSSSSICHHGMACGVVTSNGVISAYVNNQRISARSACWRNGIIVMSYQQRNISSMFSMFQQRNVANHLKAASTHVSLGSISSLERLAISARRQCQPSLAINNQRHQRQ